jgi:hypothetical protein
MAGTIWLRVCDAMLETIKSESIIRHFIRKHKGNKDIIQAVKTGKKSYHVLINNDALFAVYPRVKDKTPNTAKPTAPIKAETQKDETQTQVQAQESCTGGSSPVHPLPVIDDLPRKFLVEWENHIKELDKKLANAELYLTTLKNTRRAAEEQMRKFVDEIRI